MDVWATVKTGTRIARRWITRNAPEVLTGISIGTSVAAVALAIPATTKAQRLLEDEILRRKHDGE